MSQFPQRGGKTLGARRSVISIGERRGYHLIILTLIVIGMLFLAFKGGDEVGAQDTDPNSVRILLTVQEGDSCRGLASIFAGHENYCDELIRENAYLRESGGEDMKVGDRITIPSSWNQRVLALDGADHFIDRVPIDMPVSSMETIQVENHGIGMPGLIAGMVAALLIGILGTGVFTVIVLGYFNTRRGVPGLTIPHFAPPDRPTSPASQR